jgi:DNA-binding transcriptional MerR regulator
MLSIGDFARLGHVSPRMLRHYDETGLLRPERVDPDTGYRSYSFAQLDQLHRILALRDLGFGLEQIRAVLDDDPSVDELRGMLRLRRAEIERGLADDQARLRRVEAHLRALEGGTVTDTPNIVVKKSDPVRIAEMTETAPGFGNEHLNPVFQRVVPHVLAHVAAAGATPGIMIAWYEDPAEDGSVVLHAGFDVTNQEVPSSDDVRVYDLPVIDVASTVHRGGMEDIEPLYIALLQWIDESGYERAGASRELYLEWNDADPSASVTEIQMPLRSTSVS